MENDWCHSREEESTGELESGISYSKYSFMIENQESEFTPEPKIDSVANWFLSLTSRVGLAVSDRVPKSARQLNKLVSRADGTSALFICTRTVLTGLSAVTIVL